MTAKKPHDQPPRGPVPQGVPADSAKIAKTERLLNLVAFLLSSRTAVPFSRIKGRVAGYDDDASPDPADVRMMTLLQSLLGL